MALFKKQFLNPIIKILHIVLFGTKKVDWDNGLDFKIKYQEQKIIICIFTFIM